MTVSPPGQRFVIRRQVGAGGMGVVFEAYDNERQETVALKRLRQFDSSALYRLKREFRALADVAHPNLVPLYELIGDGSEWFFTMQFVEGTDFLSWVRPMGLGPPVIAGEPTETAQKKRPRDDVTAVDAKPVVFSGGTLQIDRLRNAMRELAEGVSALHAYGKLHRDLKPSNVLVRRDGRVVILDFGLVADLQLFENNRGVTFGGTPNYMSPEQITNTPITTASDWYSFGVILYEALTGSLPDRGYILGQGRGPIPPRDIERSLPRDLSDLAMSLLALDPRERPTGSEVLRKIGAAETLVMPRARAEAVFIGRQEQVEQLWSAYESMLKGVPVMALIHGASGMGKTSLVQHFLGRLTERDRDAVVLRGRCYEQESVPFKALDNLIDDLLQYSRRLSPLELKAITPLDVAALARVFPVLDPIAANPKRRRALDAPDSQESRRRAFAALREMLTRIADAHPLILFFDDVQWGDRDSAAVLSEILRPPDPPAALLLLAYRTTEAGLGPFVHDVNRLHASAAIGQVVDITVPALTEDESSELARAIGEISADDAKAIARASNGSPLFVSEMTHLASVDDHNALATVDDLIRARVRRLPEAARRVLNIVAVAGQPLERSVIEAAAGTTDAEAVLTLRAQHLVHSRTVQGREQIVSHHDRFGEAILAELGESERRNLHRRLAIALEHAGTRDPELLATHFAQAGENATAAMLTIEAAEKAAGTLAFDHAARLYKQALDLDPALPATNDVRIRLADALANAGRTGEAGPIYRRAAEEAEPRQALELRRRAAESLLRGGYVDEGLKAVREILAAIGMELPRTPARALAGMLWRRALLALRGQSSEDYATKNDPDLLMKIDILWATIIGLARIDNIRAFYFQPVHVRLAFESGDAYRIARALVLEAGIAGTRGGAGRKHSLALLDATEKQARRVGHPHVVGLSFLASSVFHFYVGEFRRSVDTANQADEIFRSRCTGVTWEINTAQNYLLSSLAYLGDIDELGRRVPQQLREARERGDLYASTDPAGRAGILWLALDEPDKARFAITRAMEQWSLSGFHFQHFLELYAHSQIDLYTGNSPSAYARVNERWPALKASLQLRIQFTRLEAFYLRARVAAAEARRTGNLALLDQVEHNADRIDREKMRWAHPLAEAMRAVIAAQRGDRQEASAFLRAAIGGFDGAQMALYAAAARCRLGTLIGDRALFEEGARAMMVQNVRRPEALVDVLIPGF